MIKICPIAKVKKKRTTYQKKLTKTLAKKLIKKQKYVLKTLSMTTVLSLNLCIVINILINCK